jgi:hypothetical protein
MEYDAVIAHEEVTGYNDPVLRDVPPGLPPPFMA